MSNRDIDRLKIIREVLSGNITRAEGGASLLLSVKQVGRLCAKVRTGGNSGILHGLRGRPSNHQLEAGLLEKAIGLVLSLLQNWQFF